jgi:succinate dehydrogenase / fumarate reductase cytochrome b subunit
MNLLDIFKGTVKEIKLNPNIGTFSWILHRITGLLLLFYLCAHLWVLSSINSGAEAFDARLEMVQNPIFHFLELGLVLVIFYHMCNGLSITVMDFFGLSRKHKALVFVSVAVFAILALITANHMLPRIFGSHPAGGGHL